MKLGNQATVRVVYLRRYVVRRYNVVHVVRIEIIIFLTVHVVRKYGSTFVVPSYGSTEVLSYFRTSEGQRTRTEVSGPICEVLPEVRRYGSTFEGTTLYVQSCTLYFRKHFRIFYG